MVLVICPRCKKKELHYANGLCRGCYAHKYNHRYNCSSCDYYKFDYSKVGENNG